jgi:hypothetical protein
MIAAAIAGLATRMYLWLLDAWRFMNNPYFDDPRYVKLMRETSERRKTAAGHSRISARSAGNRTMSNAAMEAKGTHAAATSGRPGAPDSPEPE